MRKVITKAARLSLLLLITVSIALSSVSCIPVSKDYATSCLDEYDLPTFDKAKLCEVERVYMKYYVEALPSPEILAEKLVAIYFEKYHEKIDTGDSYIVTDAIISSYVDAIGDKYSVYRTVEEYDEYDSDMSGTFYGIGVLVTRGEDDTVTVTEVFVDSGAEEAGILPGDIITAVEGNEIKAVGYDAALALIRGEEGTKVTVTIDRNGEKIDMTVTRKPVIERTVNWSISEDKIGYVRITSFKSTTDELFKQAIDELTEAGAVGIIYDLRSNLGGYVSSVVSALSYIAPSGTTIVSFSNDYSKPRKDNDSHELTLPAVVLTNGYTASAAELFTATIRDLEEVGHLDATIVGEKTYGKGIMQTTISLRDGSTITLTVAYYNPPSGVNYHGEGITPDVEVTPIDGSDNQLKTAYSEMKKLLSDNKSN